MMDAKHEETTQAPYEFAALERREEISSRTRREKLFWASSAMVAFLILLCLPGLYSYCRQGLAGVVSVFRNGQYQASKPEMMRKDFETWSAEKLKSFENKIQRLQTRTDRVPPRFRPEKQRAIDRLKEMHTVAQASFSELQNCDAAFWNDAQKDMVAILRDLEKAYYRGATELTGLMF